MSAIFANITSKAAVPANAPELRFACGSTIRKTTVTLYAVAMQCSQAGLVNYVCILLLPVDTSVRRRLSGILQGTFPGSL